LVADLAQPGAGGCEQLRDAEAVADLDQFSAGQHQLPPLAERGRHQREGRRTVVDDEGGLGGRDGGEQRRNRALTARTAASGGEVELDVGGAARGDDRLDRRRRQRRATEVGVHQHAGRVEHRLQAARGSRQSDEDGVDGVRGRDLAVPDPLLHLLDDILDQAAAEALPRLRQPRIGEQGVGTRHVPPRVGAHRHAA
jgi:hypothetical protein